MTRLQRRRNEVAKLTGQCGSRIVKRLDDNMATNRLCRPIWNVDDKYEIIYSVISMFSTWTRKSVHVELDK